MSHWTALQFASPSNFEDAPPDTFAADPASFGAVAPRAMRRDEIAALAQPFPERRSYRVLVPAPLELADADAPGVDREVHLLDVMQPDPGDRSRDCLVIDGVELSREDWSWSIDGTVLRWCHGAGSGHSAGELAFDGVGHRAVGSVSLDGQDLAVVAVSAVARYACRLLHDGSTAYKTSDDSLKWVKTEAWNDAGRWSGAGLVWSFWLEEYIDDYGARAYRPRVRFEDRQTGTSWEPPAGSYQAFIDGERRYHFQLSRHLGLPPLDDRSGLTDPNDRAIRTVFPVHLVLQLDASATSAEGAIEILLPDHTTQVYAVAGQSDRPTPVAAAAARTSGAEALAAAAAPLPVHYLYNLDPYDSVKVGGVETVRDAVQHEVEKSFGQIIQHYMPVELRRKFVSAAPPSLPAEVRAIAEGPVGGADPAAFYRSLARPFLALCLSGHSAKLNARRARKRFDERLARSPIYREHAVKLYRHHFLARFKDLAGYFADEKQDLPQKHQQIEQYTKKKREEYQDALAHAGDNEALREQYQKLLQEVEQARQAGLAGRYWAHRVYSHFTSGEFISVIQMQMFASGDGSGAKAALRNIQRVSTILSVLDESQFFAEQFAVFMKIYQLFAIIVQHANLAQDEKQLRNVVDEIVGRFAEENAHASDELTRLLAEQMKASVEDRKAGHANSWVAALKLVLELMFQEGNAKDVHKMFRMVADRFTPITEQIQKVIAGIPRVGERLAKAGVKVNTFASKLLNVALGLVHAAAVVSIMVTLGGGWSQFDDLNRGMLITIGVGLLANSALSILKKGQNALTVAFLSGDGYRGALKWALGWEIKTLEGTLVNGKLIETTWELLLQGELERRTGGKITLAKWTQLKGARGVAARVASRFIANLARVVMIVISGVIAIVQIIWSAIELGRATTPLEQAAHGLMIAASLLELVGLAFQGAAILAAGTAATVLGVIAGVFAGLALLVAVAGIAIMIYLMVTAKPSDPVEEFASKEAKEDGLYMPLETEIDYVLPLYDQSKRLVKEGVSLAMPPPAGGGSARYLTIDADGQVSAGALTHDQRSCFGLITDEQGRAKIYAATLSEQGEPVTRYLTLGQGGEINTEAALLTGAGAYRQLWCTELVSHQKKEGQPESWSAHLYVADDKGVKSYLRCDGFRFSSGDHAQAFELRLESTKPAGLAMDDIHLTLNSRDQSFLAFLAIGGSEPRTWDLEGQLPTFLELDRAMGAVVQKQGTAPVISTTEALYVTVKSEAHKEFTLRSNSFRVVVSAA